MCYGTILNNNERCMHENFNGDCTKPGRVECPDKADYCPECEGFYDEDNPCECEES